ncbi:hypothetical protein OIU85_000119 [Salix viminalis]|uniref:Serine-threonine/tyrosine-protein kinase catalytic domain-containing protein n=1 Tax=Salix viminalis TaxID=40686 RepID=A0A9Q0ZWK1_SALVM|nr:hypothetical protein OIU85_000119 [Salix viminalis]
MGNDFEGELPPRIFNLSGLDELTVSDLKNTSFRFPEIGNLTSINYLDLSFNDLSGSIPQSLKNAPSLDTLSLTNNKLNGSIPPWILERHKVDLSYNNFADFIKDNITDPAHHDSTEVKTLDPGKPNMDSILALSKKCTSKRNPYDEDISTESFFSVPGTWAYSCSGDFIATNRNSSEFVKNMTSDGERKLKDLNIVEMSKGPNVEWKANFTAIVDDSNPLEIHFFWAGKGSLRILNGPLVSAISVTPNFDVHDGNGKLSASQIAGITIGCAFAPLLLYLFAWQMGLNWNTELREIKIEVQADRSFNLQQIIDGTNNFSSKMENGSGRFGEVYEAKLPDQSKLAVRKISPPSEKREKDELKSDIERKISPPSEKREKDELKSDIDRKISPPSKQREKDKLKSDIDRKISPPSEKREKDELKSDNFLDILKSLSHENLVRLVDGYPKKGPVYLAPEHALGKAITVKADVYSYGIVVLEIVSGKSNAEYSSNQEADFLLDTAGLLRQQGKLLDLVDKKLGSRFDKKQALTLLHLAMECISQSPTLRPSMSEVVAKLSDIKASASEVVSDIKASASEVVSEVVSDIKASASEVVSDIKASASEVVTYLSDSKPSASAVVTNPSDSKVSALTSCFMECIQ